MSDTNTDPEAARLQTAAQWLLRLGESAEDDALVAQWLEWCDAAPENLAAFEAIQNTWQLAGAAAMAPPVPVARGTAAPPRRRRRAVWLAYAATVFVLATGAVLALLMRDRPDEAEVLATPVAIRASSTLPDGSRVELGARSRLSLRYSPTVRRVIVESGEAYFEVAHNTQRPFVVEAGGLQVTAVGTAFNVHSGDERVIVTVSEGRVRLATENAPLPGPGNARAGAMAPSLEAAAGEQALFSKKTERIAIAHADPAIAIAWRKGVLKFVNQPLADVVQDLNRYSERPIVLADAGLGALPYTGTVFGDRLDDWLHAIEDVFDVRVIKEDPQRIVIEKRKS
jgi:transmembrane sensor